MVVSRWRRLTLGALLLGLGTVGAGSVSRGEDPPRLEGPATSASVPEPPRPEAPEADALKSAGPVHEALQAAETRADSRRFPKAPPAPAGERPSDERPDIRAIWVPGYWAWDPARDDFAWVAGTWSIPPRDTIWVGGRWMRDADGWYRVPGFWSRRRADLRQTALVEQQVDWRKNGPPIDHPEDDPGAAPTPDSFLVPGHYAPDSGRLVWAPSFWARSRPGWDWIPARWVRRTDGWNFRKGHWARDVEEASRQVNQPANSDLPPAIVDSEPADTATEDDRRTTLPRNESARDLIGEDEAALRNATPGSGTRPVGPPVVVSPYRVGGPPMVYGVYGMPYRMIRPPGSIYGPTGVMVPAAVPPFVQRILDNVLP